jgi:hypothetical protein
MTIIHEHTAQRANDVLRQFLNIPGLTKFLGGLLIFTASITSIQAGENGANGTANVTLAWNPNTSPVVAGYNIYYGGASGTYSNKTSAGLATSLTISNLVTGSTYYFVATTYSAAGVESVFSSEVSYTVPTSSPGVQLAVTPAKQFILTVTGLSGHAYEIQATQDFTTWTVIGTVTVGTSGSVTFTDTNAASFTSRFYRTRDTSP